MTAPAHERVSKLMTNRGLCSRREADRLIRDGLVRVDGAVVELGAKAAPDARIEIKPSGERRLAAHVTVLLHKPKGIVSTQPTGDQVAAWTLITLDRFLGNAHPEAAERACAKPWTLATAGRLDAASRGLLVLTQDGVLARRITGGHAVAKRYRVEVDQPVSDAILAALRGPNALDGEPLLPMEVERLTPRRLRFVLREGRKHQIRRVCQAHGLEVCDLLREAIGTWELGDLPEGRWRVVTGSPCVAGG